MIRKIPEDVQAEIATLVASDQYADEESVIREGVELFGEQVRSCSGLRALFGGIALTTLLFVAITAVGAAENGPKDKPRKQGTPRRGTLAEAAARNNKVPDALAGIEKDLALYYSFDDDDEKVYDQSGNDLHGRTVGNVQYQPSFRGRAAKFTSNKTYVLCDDLNMDKWRNLTVSAWINTNRITAHAQVFSCGEVTGEQMSGFVMQVGGESKAAWNVVTEFQGRSRQGQIVYTSSLLASRMKRIGKWVHLTGVFDGKHVKFYINGKLDCQNETANNGPVMWNPKSHKLVIGNTANKSRMAWMDKYFDGLVDEVKVWKRSLTAQQIAAMHAKDANEVEQWEQKKTLLADFHRGSYKPVAVDASDVWQDAGPENVLDGNVQTFWGAGKPAPGWIELDLGKQAKLGQIDLICSQTEQYESLHHLLVSDQPIAGDRRRAKRVYTFQQKTGPHHRLRFHFPKGTVGRYVQVQTEPTKNSGWLAWSEIAIREKATERKQSEFKQQAAAKIPQLEFDGLQWETWRTKFVTKGGKLTSLPEVRSGFDDGHGGNGRSAQLMTHIGDQSWRDYRVDLDLAMLPPNPTFNPVGLPESQHGASIIFRAATMNESWNSAPGQTCYSLRLIPNGKWSLHRYHGRYRPGKRFTNNPVGESKKLAEGKAEAPFGSEPIHVRVEVVGDRITALVGDEKLLEFEDDRSSFPDGLPAPTHGGIGVAWAYECMGWIKNVKVVHLHDNSDSAKPIKFDGFTWQPGRLDFAVIDGRLATQPKVRSGFRYGHGGNGRGALLSTHIGDQTWRDYELEFDFAMLSTDRKFNPYGLPSDHRGLAVYFRAQDLRESWNEKGVTSYVLNMSSVGHWNLNRWDDYYYPGSGFTSKYAGRNQRLAKGDSLALAEATTPGHAKIRVQGNRTWVWLNDDLVADFTDKSDDPLLFGGVGIQWRYETMGWIANVNVTRLQSHPSQVFIENMNDYPISEDAEAG